MANRRRTRRRRNTHVRHHRRRRRNPGFGSITRSLTHAVKAGAAVVGGELATNYIANMIPFTDAAGTTGPVRPIDTAKRVGVAIVIGMLGRRFLGAETAMYLTVGGVASVIRGIAKTALPPNFAAQLGDAAPSAMFAAYPGALALPGVGAYPMGDAAGGQPLLADYDEYAQA